jgi:hypothetical protein
MRCRRRRGLGSLRRSGSRASPSSGEDSTRSREPTWGTGMGTRNPRGDILALIPRFGCLHTRRETLPLRALGVFLPALKPLFLGTERLQPCRSVQASRWRGLKCRSPRRLGSYDKSHCCRLHVGPGRCMSLSTAQPGLVTKANEGMNLPAWL